MGEAENRPLILPLIAEANQTYGASLTGGPKRGTDSLFYAYVDMVGAARV